MEGWVLLKGQKEEWLTPSLWTYTQCILYVVVYIPNQLCTEMKAVLAKQLAVKMIRYSCRHFMHSSLMGKTSLRRMQRTRTHFICNSYSYVVFCPRETEAKVANALSAGKEDFFSLPLGACSCLSTSIYTHNILYNTERRCLFVCYCFFFLTQR